MTRLQKDKLGDTKAQKREGMKRERQGEDSWPDILCLLLYLVIGEGELKKPKNHIIVDETRNGTTLTRKHTRN